MWKYNPSNFDTLLHYGKGHLDGGHSGRYPWGSGKSSRRQAKKDAKEYARAKMFYGEGAGTRRKLIKAQVDERSKDATYKAEFEKELSKQDMSKHAQKAKRERHTKDAVNSTTKTARGIIRLATGTFGAVSATAAVIYWLAHFTGADKKVAEFVKQKTSDAIRYATDPINRERVRSFLKNLGMH